MSVSFNTLFGNYGTTNYSNTSFMSGLYSGLSEYASIKSGSYHKLISAYYSQADTSTNSTSTDKDSAKEAATDKQLTEVTSSADSLRDASRKLISTDVKNGVFKNSDKVTDDITSAVKKYVDSYNSVIEDSEDLDSSSVTSKVNYMTNQTKAYAKSLAKVGITINSDNSLSLNEDALKEASIHDVKSLFNGNNSMASYTMTRATTIGSAAQQASNESLYGSSAVYTHSYFASAYDYHL